MEKFSNAKVGDKVFSSISGLGKITGIDGVDDDGLYPIIVEFDNGDTAAYMLDGREFGEMDKYPTLFWNKFHIPTDEEDKKPFNLVEYLKENLKTKEFKNNEDNYTFCYDYSDKKLFSHVSCQTEFPTQYFCFIKDGDITVLNDNKVTPQQLKQAYNELGWL